MNKLFYLILLVSTIYSCTSVQKQNKECHPQNQCSSYQRLKYTLPQELKWKEYNIYPDNLIDSYNNNTKDTYKNIYIVDKSPITEVNYQKFEESFYKKDTNISSILNQNIESIKSSCQIIKSNVIYQNKDETEYEIKGEECVYKMEKIKNIFVIGKIFETNNSFITIQYFAVKNQETDKYLNESENIIKNSTVEEIPKGEIVLYKTLEIFFYSLFKTLDQPISGIK